MFKTLPVRVQARAYSYGTAATWRCDSIECMRVADGRFTRQYPHGLYRQCEPCAERAWERATGANR